MKLISIETYPNFLQYYFEYKSDNTTYMLPYDVQDTKLTLCDVKRRVYAKYVLFDYPNKEYLDKVII